MRKYLVVVAGGRGLRMGGEVPKQFMPIGGRPVLMRTLQAFHDYDPQMTTALVLPVSQMDYWHTLCAEYAFDLPYQLVEGGDTRFHSVYNGLHSLEAHGVAGGLVAVHDGVRPFVSAQVIDACYRQAAASGAAIPVVPVVDTLRHREQGGTSRTVDRADYCQVQTPQVFAGALLLKAYAQPYTPAFTDDASVVEHLGVEVALVPGQRENIKLTTPFDMAVAQAVLHADD